MYLESEINGKYISDPINSDLLRTANTNVICKSLLYT